MESATRIGGRYRVDARLGGGGMADVFDAYDEVLDRPVAVKLLRGIDDTAAARRFAEEIRLTASVNHPNIVALYDAGEHDGSPFLVLERVNGGTLAGEMAAGAMDSQRVATIGEQLASALSHAHAAGIVHRDVKPTNILLAADGSVRLADFGIAVTATATRLTVTGTVAGSAGYVSPEQVLGTGAGTPADIYALGLVLLECLVGTPPWSGTTVEVALARITADPPIPADLPVQWRTLLAAMTARQPEARPHIDLVGHALSKLATGEDFETRFFVVPTPTDRRVPAVAGMSVLVLLFSAFAVLSSNVSPQVAAADSLTAVSLPAADSILSKAVGQPTEAPVAAAAPRRQADDAKDDRPERKRKRSRDRDRVAKRDSSRRQSSAPATAAAATQTTTRTAAAPTGSTARDTDTRSATDLPRVSVSTTTTNVAEPKIDDTVTRTVEEKLTGLRKAAQRRTTNNSKDKDKLSTLLGR